MSLTTAEEVYNAWALPGGVRAEDWWITASVRAFLTSTGMGEVKGPRLLGLPRAGRRAREGHRRP
ncbi:hypothetical protein [Nocardioides convexus]|uniref:hypothetical protein n=1 Tax=Nocardioides convexus TaxID=2712224 RepID=UPI0024186846|nr:hypothetical protein [Nocardioides convexus]